MEVALSQLSMMYLHEMRGRFLAAYRIPKNLSVPLWIDYLLVPVAFPHRLQITVDSVVEWILLLSAKACGCGECLVVFFMEHDQGGGGDGSDR